MTFFISFFLILFILLKCGLKIPFSTHIYLFIPSIRLFYLFCLFYHLFLFFVFLFLFFFLVLVCLFVFFFFPAFFSLSPSFHSLFNRSILNLIISFSFVRSFFLYIENAKMLREKAIGIIFFTFLFRKFFCSELC